MSVILTAVLILYVLSYILPLSTDGAGVARFLPAHKLLSPHHDGITINGKDRLKEKDSKHSLVVAATGTGKTTEMIIPSLLQHDDCSIIVLDPKGGELYKACAGYLEEKGYEVKLFDYQHPEHSFFFNPLERCNTDSELRQLAKNIYDCTNNSNSKADKIWENGCIRLLLVLLSCIKQMPKEYQTLATLNRFVTLFDDGSPKIPYIVSTYAPNEEIKEAFDSIQHSEMKIKMGWISTALASLSAFSLQGIQILTSRDTIDFASFREKKTVVFLNFPVGVSDSYGVLINLFYTQFFRYLLTTEKKENDLPVYCYLEELGNSRVPELEKFIALLRAKKVHFICVLQALSQLKREYGENNARTIINNCSNTIIYSGTKDVESLKYIEELLGEGSSSSFADIGGKKGGKRSLMSKYEIRTMNHALFIASDKPAIKIYPTPIYRNNALMAKAGLISVNGQLVPLDEYIPYQHGLSLKVPRFSFETKEDETNRKRQTALSTILTPKTNT